MSARWTRRKIFVLPDTMTNLQSTVKHVVQKATLKILLHVALLYRLYRTNLGVKTNLVPQLRATLLGMP
jgi:glycerol-3-phosphate responsive antiterminator